MSVSTRLLDEYISLKPNHKIWKCLDNGNFEQFKSILMDNKNKDLFSIQRVVVYLIGINDCRRKFLKFLMRNNGKYWWKINDFTIIIAYAVNASDFQTLKLFLDVETHNNTNTEKFFQITQYFTKRQLRRNNVLPAKYIYDFETILNKHSILDLCISSKYTNFGKMEENGGIDGIGKHNENYKCFELLMSRTMTQQLIKSG